ncbi:MAG: hypothetical protein IIC96_13445 [Chloroflexi bacterium]|nr:hypothetical protein [Chloroflexota bacterium]
MRETVKRVESIIDDGVDGDGPPYGYILVAPANFSKAAHDTFREELRTRGVMEFYLWGAGELEDMLYQPKNDHILFAFFGFSLTTRRRSWATEIRATVSSKNKLIKVLGDRPVHERVLLRDIKDTNYPFERDYPDFEAHPRWKEYAAIDFHPLGLVVAIGRYYAYIDKIKGEWDYAKTENNVPPVGSMHRSRDADSEAQKYAVKGFWEQLPHANKATFVRNGLIGSWNRWE